jgi:hypothetical protein
VSARARRDPWFGERRQLATFEAGTDRYPVIVKTTCGVQAVWIGSSFYVFDEVDRLVQLRRTV